MTKPLTLSASTLAAALALAICAGSAAAASSCDRVASPSGSDTAPGTAASPFRTPQHLLDSLSAGQTGCLRSGSYSEDVRVGHGGAAGSPIVLTSYPGERATVVGRFWVAQGSDHLTVTGVNLDGRNSSNLPSPTVNANDVTFSSDDVTNEHTAICFDLGNQSWGTAGFTVITKSSIHDCGVLPAANHDHAIYVSDATNTRIEWNLIYDNADRGVQLYPNAQHTTVDHNVIDSNGEGVIFSGDGGVASNNNVVYDNLLTNAQIRYDAESWYPTGNPLGLGNAVHDNCVWGGREGLIDTSSGGFSAFNNTTADPQYVNAGAHDYHLSPSSACLPITGDIAAAVDNTAPTQPQGTPNKRLRRRAGIAVRRHRHRHHHRRRHRRARRKHAKPR